MGHSIWNLCRPWPRVQRVDGVLSLNAISAGPQHTASPAPLLRLDFVDGLRGVACLYVVAYHLFLLWPVSSHSGTGGGWLIELLTRTAAYGHIGVDIFLALSGFCLFYPFCRRAVSAHHRITMGSLRTYGLRRARRILPPYLVALAIFSVLPIWSL